MIDELEGKIIAGKYRLDSLLADGEFGPVYRGSNILLDKPVTVKVLAPALAIDRRFVDRFIGDAKAVSQAGHPAILNVLDFGTDTRDLTYAVFEEAGSETLAELIARETSLAVGDAADLARQAARGLASAHSVGLVHGRLTPEKIFVSADDGPRVVKLFDLGSEPVGKAPVTGVEYQAPETYDGAKPDQKADVYALGVIFYEMLTGVVPFIGKTTAELKQKQDSEPPPPLSAFRADLPADVEPIILSAIASDPEKRYPTMKAFAEDLELLTSGVGKPASAVTTAATEKKHNIWQTAAIAFVGVAVLAGALIYGTSVKRADPTDNMQADAGSLPVQPIGPATGAQEDSLAKLPALTPEEIMMLENSNTALPLAGSVLPGGDNYNPWANGGAPPAGAPLSVGPPGATISGDPNTGSQFMPNLDFVCKDVTTGQVVPCPTFDNKPQPKGSPTPKTPAANTAVPAATPRTLATPPPRNPATAQPSNRQRPPQSGPAGDSTDVSQDRQ